MKKRRVEILILLFTCILILSVITIGSITFKNLKIIEKQSEKIYEPNRTVFTLKLLLSELRNAENSMKSYSLYHNSDYLKAYQNSLEQMNSCFDTLYYYQSNLATGDLLDTTEALVEKKLSFLYAHLSLRNEKKVINELNKINIKLNKVYKADTIIIRTVKSKEPEKKRSFFSRLFGSKEISKKKNLDKDSLRIVLNKSSIDDVKKEIYKVKKKQTIMFAEMNEKEFYLIKQDKIIWSRLLNILTVLENKQNDLLKAIALQNIEQTEKTHSLTKAFGLLILILLSFLMFFSLYYFYSGSKYRAKLKKALNEANAMAEAKENFLATMSHEMRTPLNAIAGFTEQLKNSKLNTEQENQLDIINSASNHLVNLINDVLDLSKIEAEKIFFEKIEFNPVVQIQEAFNILKPKVSDKKLNIFLNFSADVPKILLGDPLRLKQVVLNLLGNSIKFTNEGYIQINVSILKQEPVDSKQVILFITIKDTGIGISHDMQDEIFKSFTQADTSISRRFGGSGLGMSITKKIVELQCGKIKIDSQVNKGCTIIVEIPYGLAYSEITTEKFNEEKYLTKLPAGKRILIADDEPFNRALLIAILKRAGLEYEEAQNGMEVMEKVNKNNYDLILMDVRMPEMNGIEASMQIRQLPSKEKATIPIIGITAVTSHEKKCLCINAGMDEVITKPYKEKELLKAMENILKTI